MSADRAFEGDVMVDILSAFQIVSAKSGEVHSQEVGYA